MRYRQPPKGFITRRQITQLLGASLILGLFWLRATHEGPPSELPVTPTAQGAIEQAFASRRSDVLVTDEGRVARLLADDTHGARHQRFIVELASGHTVLIAHNIDIAPRIADLERGRPVGFRGVYEWNDLGGVVHWTHHDPDGEHPGGWIQYRDRRYD